MSAFVTVPEYTAEIERNLFTGDWVIRVCYVDTEVQARRRWKRFVLVPSHQGAMFSDVCEEIEAAIVAHKAGRTVRQAVMR